MTARVLQLFVFRKDVYIGSEVFTKSELLIGSRENVDIYIPGDIHAILTRNNHEIKIAKLGQTGDLRVNNEAVRDLLVTPNDDVQFGEYTIKYKLVAPSTARQISSIPKSDQYDNPTSFAAKARTSPPANHVTQAPKVRSSFGTANDALNAMSRSKTTRRPTSNIEATRTKQPGTLPNLETYSEITQAISPQTSVTSDPHTEVTYAQFLDGSPDATSQMNQAAGDLPKSMTSTDRAPNEVRYTSTLDNLPPFLSTQTRTDSSPFLDELTQHIQYHPPSASTEIHPEDHSVADIIDTEATIACAIPLDDINEREEQTLIHPPHPSHPSYQSTPNLPPLPKTFPVPPLAPIQSSAFAHKLSTESKSAPQNTGRPHYPKPIPSALAGALPSSTESPSISTKIEAPPLRSAPRRFPSFNLNHDPFEEDMVEPDFSLLATLTDKATHSSRGTLLEVIHAEQNRVRHIELLSQTKSLAPDEGKKSRPVKVEYLSSGRALITFNKKANGFLEDQHNRYTLETLSKKKQLQQPSEATYSIQLVTGQYLTLRYSTSTYYFKYIQAPTIPAPKQTKRSAVVGPILRAVGSSLLAHAGLAMLVGFLAPAVSYSKSAREVWATVESPFEMPDPIAAVPPQPTTSEATPDTAQVEVDEPPPSPPPEPPPPAMLPNSAESPPTQRAGSQNAPKRQVIGILSRVGSVNRGQKGVFTAMSSAVAVRAPGSASYRVGPLVSKAPTAVIDNQTITLSQPSLTRGTADLLRKDDISPLGSSPAFPTGYSSYVEDINPDLLRIRGSLSQDQVATVLNRHMEEIIECYEQKISTRPDLRNQLKLKWKIQRDGKVSSIRIARNLLDRRLVRCMVRRLRTWQFPRPNRGSVTVTYPFSFINPTTASLSRDRSLVE
ncbi:MAG: AgmX/PglI C-terminal domain-containing protein [Myxococcales bacterium]|nr:AgmX/PglI C-terminal domain-containing protein [Myxococcales bacterium]